MPYDWTQLEKAYGLPPGLLNSVMMQESKGNPNAVNKTSGAKGLFQFMPATAKQYGVDPMNPNSSAMGAAHYFHDLSQLDNGDVDKMLADYNWGHHNRLTHGLEHAPSETKHYIQAIEKNMGLKPSGTPTATNQGTNASLGQTGIGSFTPPSIASAASNSPPPIAPGAEQASQGYIKDQYSSFSPPSNFDTKGANMNTEGTNRGISNSQTPGDKKVDLDFSSMLSQGLAPDMAMAPGGQSMPLGSSAPGTGPSAQPSPVAASGMAAGNQANAMAQMAGAPQQQGNKGLAALLPLIQAAMGGHGGQALYPRSAPQPMGRERMVTPFNTIPQAAGIQPSAASMALLQRLQGSHF